MTHSTAPDDPSSTKPEEPARIKLEPKSLSRLLVCSLSAREGRGEIPDSISRSASEVLPKILPQIEEPPRLFTSRSASEVLPKIEEPPPPFTSRSASATLKIEDPPPTAPAPAQHNANSYKMRISFLLNPSDVPAITTSERIKRESHHPPAPGTFLTDLLNPNPDYETYPVREIQNTASPGPDDTNYKRRLGLSYLLHPSEEDSPVAKWMRVRAERERERRERLWREDLDMAGYGLPVVQELRGEGVNMEVGWWGGGSAARGHAGLDVEGGGHGHGGLNAGGDGGAGVPLPYSMHAGLDAQAGENQAPHGHAGFNPGDEGVGLPHIHVLHADLNAQTGGGPVPVLPPPHVHAGAIVLPPPTGMSQFVNYPDLDAAVEWIEVDKKQYPHGEYMNYPPRNRWL